MTLALRHDGTLERFIEAQQPVYADVLRELRAGAKRSHWMWFVFPQIRGLGESMMSEKFAIASATEAGKYLNHEVLGRRLQECTQLVLQVRGKSVLEILGYPDNLKFHSCMTLFAHVSPDQSVFHEALARYYSGAFDLLTLERLQCS
jgi:uncharacterized protein (DUF1810 family)